MGFDPGSQARRAIAMLRAHGLRRFTISVISWIFGKIGIYSRKRMEYQRRKARADAEFDGALGISTGGVEYLHDLTISSPNAHLGTNHVATDPEDFKAILRRCDFDLKEVSFVDFGSGRGRALILAASFPFQKIIGIEFAEELHKAGKRNVELAGKSIPAPERIMQILADAAQFPIPGGPLMIYLFNPFQAPIIAAVARNAIRSWQADPRPMRVIYVNPIHAAEWLASGWITHDEGPGFVIFAPK